MYFSQLRKVFFQSNAVLFKLQILTKPLTLQLQSTLQLLQQDTMTFHPHLQDCLLLPTLLTLHHSPAISAHRLFQAPLLTLTTSRSCRLKSSACSTVEQGGHLVLEAQRSPPSHRCTALLTRLPLRTNPAKSCLAPLSLDPRVIPSKWAACQSQ